ncbi:hypothetical protein Tco_1070988 [Tanacetum coccineum]|uniref:Uncharacterized protein n=1 Tax=Tanacetum coccineum TaxID=301880 RepID=A0ABQ5HN14_9ASTR
MSSSAKNQNKNKFYEFHGDKGHNTDDFIHLKKQIKETVKSGQLSHHIKELKQGNTKGDHPKAAKKGKAFRKEKALVIFMTLGHISLQVSFGDKEHSMSAWMNFMVVRSPSPYNGMIGRLRIRKIKVVISTAHGMFKFRVLEGVVTLQSSRVAPIKLRMVTKPTAGSILKTPAAEGGIKVAIHQE